MIRTGEKKVVAFEKVELTILKTLAYFDVFNYPLTENEIKNFLGCYISEERFKPALLRLVFGNIIFSFGEFYSLQNDAGIAEKRMQGNWRAKKLIPKAAKIGAFLYRFPYIRAVGVSGSLSKNYADEKADIDFFIITKKDRLWIARTFLHLFKKLTYLTGHQHFYCMNYFVDEEALLIPEQNIYSAIEVMTLLPVAGMHTINDFFKINDWTDEWLPACSSKEEIKIPDKNFALKRFFEKIFDKKAGERIDSFLFKWTTQRWNKKKYLGRKNIKGRKMNLVTGKHFSKSDPEAFQSKVLARYETKIDELSNRHTQYF